MSGAAGIAAAKNRRSKTEPNQKQLPPPISCGKNGNGSCPPQNKPSQNKSSAIQTQAPSDLIDPTSLQILGPMLPVQILRVHEQRLNRLDERLTEVSHQSFAFDETTEQSAMEETDINQWFNRTETLESKVTMLEEVIMTLQNKLTIAQNFAMETNLSMSSLMKKYEQLQTQQTLQSNAITVVDITQPLSAPEETSTSGQISPTTVDSASASYIIQNNYGC